MDAESSPDEARLAASMIAYQAGELDGFTDLYAELAGDLERFFAGAAGWAVAEDLMQETFLEIHRSRRSYRPPRPVRPWVFGLARNVLRRHRRAAWRRERKESAAGAAAKPATGATRAEDAALAAGDVQDALRRLPAGRREAWLLHHQHGWSFHEIAARLSIGVDAAKRRASRAMGDLRRALGAGTQPARAADKERKNGGDSLG
ncbi:MAG TPA: RNA polymerase sigma factor [Thermoanaerobaculia bacterium]|jgi:RNA polymerase sigma-70 factor (ECF subfamily)|nr:RNA polymerase sigma factor [Thermoanaerobaculia bacterium]